MIPLIVLGIVQGLTEFLPVSSSAHLVILQKLFGMRGEEVAVAVVLHAGTALSILVFFRREIIGLLRDRRSIMHIAVVTLITGVIAVTGKEFFEGLFASPAAAAAALLVTGALLLSTRAFMSGSRTLLTGKDAVLFGGAQAIAIIPGISRSGITITSLLLRGVERVTVFRFSFLASIPAIMGAMLLEARDIGALAPQMRAPLLAGFCVSFAVGLGALALLKAVLSHSRFYLFGYYCIALATFTLLYIR